MIHIDGEHTPEHLKNDFKLGVAVRSERGVLVLDDMLHPAYPLLGQAVHDCLKRHPELQVLAVIDREDIVGAAKFVIGRREDRAFYETGLRRAFPEYVWSMPAQFEDYQALVLTPEPRLAQVF